MKDAPILLLDEATSALDAQSEARIQEALGEILKGRTAIIAAHRLATVRNADIIFVLDKGQVVEKGTHGDLASRKGLYAELCRLQLETA